MFRKWTVDNLIIVSTTLCVLAEVVINFATSYQHIYDLGLKYGEYGVDARLMPVGIDLMLLAFAEVNLFLSRRGRKSTWMRLGLALGVAGTVAANAAYGAFWGQTGGFLAVWSPVALFATVEAGMLLLRVAAEDKDKTSPTGLTGAFTPVPKLAPWETASGLPAYIPAGTGNETTREGKAPSPQQRGLNGIGFNQDRNP